MNNSSELTRKNGCILTDCIIELPCPNKHPPKTGDGFCIYYNNGTKRNAIEQVKKICRMMGILFEGFKKYPVKSTPQQYEQFIKKAIRIMEQEREMWLMYCDWKHEANAISLQARVRVIMLTQLLGDGDEFSKKINQKLPKK